jgi:hypothetical protein
MAVVESPDSRFVGAGDYRCLKSTLPQDFSPAARFSNTPVAFSAAGVNILLYLLDTYHIKKQREAGHAERLKA